MAHVRDRGQLPPQGRLRLRQKAALTGEILAAYVSVRRGMRRADVRHLVESVRAGVTRADASQAPLADGLRIGNAVTRVLGPLPFDSRCLARSLVVTRLLERRSISSSLVIGVRPGPDFAAHAWVEVDGLPVLPPGEKEFSRLTEF